MYPQNDDLKKIQTARGLRKNNPGNEQHLEEHLAVKRYGNFLLTDAIRPSYSLPVIPKQGYRHEVYNDPKSGKELPLVMASASMGVWVAAWGLAHATSLKRAHRAPTRRRC